MNSFCVLPLPKSPPPKKNVYDLSDLYALPLLYVFPIDESQAVLICFAASSLAEVLLSFIVISHRSFLCGWQHARTPYFSEEETDSSL